jgi:hypothetical protein
MAGRTPEETQALLDRNKELVDILEKQNLTQDKIVDILTRVEEAEARRLANDAKRLNNLEQELKFLTLIESADEKRNEAYDSMLESLYGVNSVLEKQLGNAKQILDIKIEEEEKSIKEAIRNGEDKVALENKLKNLKDIKEARERIADAAREEQNANEKGKEAFSAILNNLGIKAKDQKLTLIESIAVGEVSIKQFKKAYEEMFSFRNAVAALGAKIFESSLMMAKSMDEARASVYKLSGGNEELSKRIMGMTDAAKDAQVATSELGAAYASLLRNSSNFSQFTEGQQTQLSKTVAQMQKLGANTDTVTKNISTFTQALGMTPLVADNASKQIVQLSNVLNISLEQASSDFASVSNNMVVYGQQAVQQFKLLASESKALGISVNELVGIVSKADTFQGAAEQAGRLNAMLGGGLLNSSQLLTASEGERIKMIRNAVIESGRSFDQLSKYERIAIANAAGIKDMTTAQKLFNQNISDSDIDSYTNKMNSFGMTQAEMEKHTLNAQTATEKIRITMEKFAIAMTPIINFIHMIVDGFNKMGSFGTGVVYVLFALMATLKIYNSVQALTNGIVSAGKLLNLSFALSEDAVTTASMRMNRSMMIIVGVLLAIALVMHMTRSPPFYLIFFTFGLSILFASQMAEQSKSNLLAMAASLLMIGIGVHLAASGLAKLADSFSKLNPNQLMYLSIVIGVLTVALLAMFAGLGMLVYTGLGLAAAGVLLAFGAAMLMAGGGALLFGAGMSMVVDSLANLTQNVQGLILLPAVLYATAAAMLTFTAAMLSLVPILSFGTIPLMAFVGLIYLLGKAIDSISPEKSIAIKTTVDSIKEITLASKNVETKDLQNLEGIVEQIHKFNVEAAINKTLNITAPFKELIDAISGQTGAVTAAANAKQQTNVIMKLNEREFGKAVVDVLNDRGTSSTVIKKANT